ncbi:hypothetical protein GCM10016455_27890 [Aliiroseovarius zhejiangensis]|uniref:Uncharacterized protein n=1 Tax=Aliiroseovarius zhejiangensis TaxID=1632025 RepID=A0ABQ3JAI3_9RHOB|nr:hypothetical protein [Aliiroseovarius zhejiangensis]GHF05027.1 hypothetical protein GCM10016455_27890 [Aliiroseovarius zhejiangensis]
MKLAGALILAGLLLQPTKALADRYETTRLFNHKAWSVELTHDQLDDDFWCNAETTNRAGQVFSITAYDNGNLGLFIFDRRWDINPRDIEFRIDIDYSRWNVSGQAQESYVSTFLGDPENSIKFLTELAEGSAVAVFNSDGRRLAVHSLSGSSASLRKLLECWNRIKKTDPFGTSPNASAPKSDPF